ncbi:MAG TPA: hypothetical protein VKN63_05090, partial [Afifellaceae bacterium]|nr:hypothetical protein [Afifellaceae bacterium]
METPPDTPLLAPPDTRMEGAGAKAAYRPQPLPEVRAIAPGDVLFALKAGASDFLRAPWFGLFFGGIYAAG